VAHPGRIEPQLLAGQIPQPLAGQIIDTSVVKKLLTMMPRESLLELFSACIADTRSCIRDLQKYIMEGGSKDETVSPLAHRIKGAASMVGAVRLARLAAGLEVGGSKEAATPGILDDLLNACSELERMLLAGNLTKT
jgi:HPt (histidine-containing phosphotransfer) domain-containing protein